MFDGLTTVCTAWRQATTGDPAAWAASYKRELLESLVRLGVTDEARMRVGLTRLKASRREFLPNPEAFAEMCVSPEDLGLPSEDAAYRMAAAWRSVPFSERHPAVLSALQELDSWQFRRLPDDQARKEFRAAWQRVVARVRAQGTGCLPDVPDELPYQPPGERADPEQARAAIGRILRDLERHE